MSDFVFDNKICSKEQYNYFCIADKIANHADSMINKIYHYPQCHFLKLLRKAEYYHNVKKRNLSKAFAKLMYYFYLFRETRYGQKYGWTIGLNAVGPGLFLPHVGTVVINKDARIGKNATINVGVIIGANGSKGCPILGDNITINANVTIVNEVTIADDVTIGANAFVNKSFEEKGITIAGIPAKKICDAYINRPVCNATELIGVEYVRMRH